MELHLRRSGIWRVRRTHPSTDTVERTLSEIIKKDLDDDLD